MPAVSCNAFGRLQVCATAPDPFSLPFWINSSRDPGIKIATFEFALELAFIACVCIELKLSTFLTSKFRVGILLEPYRAHVWPRMLSELKYLGHVACEYHNCVSKARVVVTLIRSYQISTENGCWKGERKSNIREVE